MKKITDLEVKIVDGIIWVIISSLLMYASVSFREIVITGNHITFFVTVLLTKILSYQFDSSSSVILEYFGIDDTVPLFKAEMVTLVISLILSVIFKEQQFIYILVLIHLLNFILRVTWRLRYKKIKFGVTRNNRKNQSNVLIYGAGASGVFVANEIATNPIYNWRICGFIDDNVELVGGLINGVKVLATGDSLAEIVNKMEIDEIIVCMPSSKKYQQQNVMKKAISTGAKVKNTSSTETLFSGDSLKKKLKDVDVSDLLGRPEIVINDSNINEIIKDRNILVTGGGGSIGSELARQITSYNPKTLVLLDISENSLYEIEMELTRKQSEGVVDPNINIVALVASIRDKNRLDDIFKKCNFDIVFHAAAHKHVPLMETSPHEAIKNNIFGTLNLIETTNKYEVAQFINISTDKAVNPTNVMGSTKRFIEMMLQAQLKNSSTNYCAVRFGNVLGSNGSVIPLFKKQIEAGGPVTVTHKDIIRYFMTIPEAVSLVLQAGTYAKGGEIFVLDMGKPVKILSLAEQLIKLSGFEPYQDIEIKITGLRPGEKLFEELLLVDEGLKVTDNNLIFIATPSEYDFSELKEQVEELRKVIDTVSTSDLILMLQEYVPTFDHKPNDN